MQIHDPHIPCLALQKCSHTHTRIHEPTNTHTGTENYEDFIFLSFYMCLPSSTSLPLSISLPCLSCPLYPPYLIFSPSHFSLAISFHPSGAGFKRRPKHYWTCIAPSLCDRTANVRNLKHEGFYLWTITCSHVIFSSYTYISSLWILFLPIPTLSYRTVQQNAVD